MNNLTKAIKDQMLASLCTLNQCIENCPNKEWNESHKDAPFSQVLFHTLFYLDYYLSLNENEFKEQDFHKANKNMFRDYEELDYKKAENIYTKEEIVIYMNFCHGKIDIIFEDIGDTQLEIKTNHNNMILGEILMYTIRHTQHHAAQLGLRIQQITSQELKWIKADWKN
jgi:uncharacterized damage-inducible protein DinB